MLALVLLGAGCVAALRVLAPDARRAEVRAGERFRVTLSSPGIEYAWRYLPEDGSAVVVRASGYEPYGPADAPHGVWEFDFTASQPGETRLHFACRTTAEGSTAPPLSHHYLYLTVLP